MESKSARALILLIIAQTMLTALLLYQSSIAKVRASDQSREIGALRTAQVTSQKRVEAAVKALSLRLGAFDRALRLSQVTATRVERDLGRPVAGSSVIAEIERVKHSVAEIGTSLKGLTDSLRKVEGVLRVLQDRRPLQR